jgi:hypothetical protein
MSHPVWRKSRRSTTQGGDCVEVARLPQRIGVRDSKNPGGAQLALSHKDFSALLGTIKAGNLHI